jgi:hypothetical protein
VLRDARRTYNANAATRLQSKYIADFDDATESTTPVLTLNVYDRDFYRTEVQDERPDQDRPVPTLKSHGLIRKARDYFAERIEDEAERAGGGKAAFERNLRLGKVLCDHMSVVVVSSTDEDNAAAVFETLNDRGIGLSTPDLLRNLLLRKAGSADARARIVSAWQIVLGIADEANVDDFLRHFWVSHRGDVKARKLYRELKDTILAEDMNPVQLSLDLAAAAPIYRDIVRAQDPDREQQRLLDAIRAMGAKVLYPAVLSGYAATGEDDSKDNLRKLTAALVALFVRYNVVGGRESTTLEAKIFETAAVLRGSKDFDAAIASLRELAPTPAEFVSRFHRVSVSRIATARYLLREIEHAKRVTQEVTVDAPDRVHVEHIYPQTPEAGGKWANHSQVINRLGNLTLLGKRLNTAIKNADFATKKEEGYKNSDLVLTKELLAIDVWDVDAIDTRQVELSNWICGIWAFPGEEAGAGTAAPAPPTENEELSDLPEVPE